MMIRTRAFREEHGPDEIPSDTMIVGPRPLTEEERLELTRLRNQRNEPIEYPDNIKAMQEEVADQVMKQRSDLVREVITPYIDALKKEQKDTWDKDIQTLRDISMDTFIDVRTQDLNEIVDYMKENGVTSSEASRILDIPLLAKEQDFFNRHPSSQPLINKGMISGDIVTEMTGRNVPRDVEFPTLNIAFDGGVDIDQIKAIVENHPTFQELQTLLDDLDIDFSLLDSSTDSLHGEHQLSLYNPERTRRELPPIKIRNGEPEVHPLDGPLEQNEDGSWEYRGTLFDQNIHELLSFVNSMQMNRILEDLRDVESLEKIRGDKDDHVIVEKHASQEDINKFYAPWFNEELGEYEVPEGYEIPEGGRTMPHYEMPDGSFVPVNIARQLSPAWERIDDGTSLESEWGFQGSIHKVGEDEDSEAVSYTHLTLPTNREV